MLALELWLYLHSSIQEILAVRPAAPPRHRPSPAVPKGLASQLSNLEPAKLKEILAAVNRK